MMAIAIFSLLVAAVYSTWVVILKSAQVGQEAAAPAQRERIAIRTLEDSLTCIQSFQASMRILYLQRHQRRPAGLEFRGARAGYFPAQRKI